MEFESLTVSHTINTVPNSAAQNSPIQRSNQEAGETGRDTNVNRVTNKMETGDAAKLSNKESDQNSKKEHKMSEKDIENVIDTANKQLKGTFREFQYRIHKETNQVMIKVVDSDTKETIREIPPEKALDAIAKMWELAGIIVDEKK